MIKIITNKLHKNKIEYGENGEKNGHKASKLIIERCAYQIFGFFRVLYIFQTHFYSSNNFNRSSVVLRKFINPRVYY